MKTISILAFACLSSFPFFGQASIAPIVANDYKNWTSSAELNKWLLQLGDIYSLEMRLYQGSKEVNLPVVVIPAVQDEALRVMVIAEQQGDQPSGMEACNLLISELLSGELPTWTDSIEWIIVPMVNAEAHDAKTRKKKNGADLSRDHLILSQPETRYVHNIFNRYAPDVFIDLHEYPFESGDSNQPLEKRIQQQVGCITNPALSDSELSAIAQDFILPHVHERLKKSKISFSEYFIGSGHLGKSISRSTVDIDDARHGLGAMGKSLSFVVEGLNGKNRNDSIFYRTQCQYKCLLSLVEGCQLKKDFIKKGVQSSRDNAIYNSLPPVPIQMDHYAPSDHSQSLQLNYWNIQTNKDTILELGHLYLSEVKTINSIEPPLGYWVSKKDERLVGWIQAHEAGIFPFSDGNKKVDFKEGEDIFLQCIVAMPEWKTQTLEGMHVPAWKPEWMEMKNPNTKDYIFISTRTINGIRWIMALEPESMFSLTRYPEFEYLRYQYPILRETSR